MSNLYINRPDYRSTPESTLEAVKYLPGLRKIIDAAVETENQANLAEADKLDAQVEMLDAELDAHERASAPELQEANDRVTAIIAQLAEARRQEGEVRSQYLGRRSTIVEARRTAYRKAHDLRATVARARGEDRPPTIAELEAIKVPTAPPLFNPMIPHPYEPAHNGWRIG